MIDCDENMKYPFLPKFALVMFYQNLRNLRKLILAVYITMVHILPFWFFLLDIFLICISNVIPFPSFPSENPLFPPPAPQFLNNFDHAIYYNWFPNKYSQEGRPCLQETLRVEMRA